MQRFYKIIVVFVLVLTVKVCQGQVHAQNIPGLSILKPVNNATISICPAPKDFAKINIRLHGQAAQQPVPYALGYSSDVLPAMVIAPDFYTTHFGFFCRKELQLEKSTGIPLRFRLGSINYCDYLEGKPSGTKIANQ